MSEVVDFTRTRTTFALNESAGHVETIAGQIAQCFKLLAQLEALRREHGVTDWPLFDPKVVEPFLAHLNDLVQKRAGVIKAR